MNWLPISTDNAGRIRETPSNEEPISGVACNAYVGIARLPNKGVYPVYSTVQCNSF